MKLKIRDDARLYHLNEYLKTHDDLTDRVIQEANLLGLVEGKEVNGGPFDKDDYWIELQNHVMIKITKEYVKGD